ncbi:unknown [Bacillus sp. CAG:988]|nr:unknown [Bacillus sp. CAG:988]
MKKINYLILYCLALMLFMTPNTVLAADKPRCGASGIDAGKWQFSETIKGDEDDGTGVFNDMGSSGRKCCSSGYAGNGIQYYCDIYTLIDNQEGNEVNTDRIYDPDNAITCDYSLDGYTYDYTQSGFSDNTSQNANTTICCTEQGYNSGNYTCSYYVAQEVVDDGYEAGGSAGTDATGENNSNSEREDLEDLRGDMNANCDAIFDSEAQALIQRIFSIICIAVPIILIVLGSVDFANAVLSSDQEAMQKAVKRFTTRCIVAVAIFFLPMLVNLIFSFPGMDAVRGVIFCDV